MITIMRNFILGFFITLLSFSGFAQEFQNISIDDGLSSHIVYSIKQYNSTMWFSTKLGVDRYDGSSFKHYNLYPDDKIMELGHRKYYLQNDKYGRFWVNNNYEVFLYDKFQDNFNIVYSEKNSLISDVLIADSLNLFMATYSGLIKHHIGTKKTTAYPELKHRFNLVAKYDNDIIILVAKNLILAFNHKKGEILKDIISPVILKEINQKNITALNVDQFKNIYLGSKGKIISFKINDSTFKTSATLNKLFNNSEIKKIINYNDDLYVGTEGAGLLKINNDLTLIKSFTYDINNPSTIKGNLIFDIYIDHDERIWVAGEGVNYFDPNKLKFKVFQHQTNNSNSLIHNYVRAIKEDANGNLWIGTKYGISIFNRVHKTWKHITQKSTNGILTSGDILSLEKHPEHHIIAGTYKSGYYFIDKNLNIKKSSLNQNISIFNILADDKALWLGSSTGANYLSGNANQEFKIRYVLSIAKHKNGDIVTAGHDGLNIISPNGKITSYSAITHKIGSIFCVKIDKKGQLWGASEGQGLIKFLDKGKIKKYTVKNGLPSNIVYGILEDKRGHLWLSTTNGLSRFNPEKEEFINYNIGDGLNIREFNYGAATETSAGEFVFGGINGLVIFKPEDIFSVPIKTKLMFTDFKIFNVSSKAGENGSPLSQVIDQTDTISLKHNQNSITFDFTSVNYTNLSQTLYTWKLEGLDKTWSPPGIAHTAIYTNLKPGKYTFTVKSTTPDPITQTERTVFIHISPPFWATYWAYLLYLTILGAIIYFSVKFYHIKVNEEHAKDKINFFTSIAHDIRTPLSLIRSPLSLALKRPDVSAETFKFLQTADQNAERLSQLINQLLEFESADEKKNPLLLSPIHMEAAIADLCTNFTPYLEERGLTLLKKFKQEKTTMYVDKDKFDKIIFNLLSNAIKYTPKGGQVEIITDIIADQYLIEFIDTGVGIPKEQQKHIFQRYFRAQNVLNSNETGSGIGLMLIQKYVQLHKGTISFESTEDKGSTFSILLPYIQALTPAINNEIKKEEILEVPPVHQAKNVVTATLNGKKPRLLIAEDHIELRNHLMENLSDVYTVYTAENGKEALALTKKIFPDIIISDVMMPEMNGNEFCYEIKNNFETSHIPFILLTSLTATTHKIDGINTGADIYLEKPFDLDLLNSYLSNLLQNQKRLKEKFMKSEFSVNDELGKLDKEFITKVIKIIDDNLSNSDFLVDDFEKSLGMSHAALYRKFKTLIGKTPLEFINQYKLKCAAELLQQGTHNVNEIAYQVGFSDPKYFSSSFKKQFGSSPSKYKEKHSLYG